MELDGYVRVAKHAGLSERGPLLDALASLEGDPGEIADRLRRHHLIRLVRAQVPDDALRARLPAELVDALTTRPPVGRVPIEVLLRTYDEVRRALAAGGVEVLVLKGFYFAERLYGGIARRPQHDVDVLVRPRDFRTALQVLRSLGFARRKRDLHSLAVQRGDVQIDVHRYLRWAPAFAIDEAAMWRTARDASIDGIDVRTLSDEYTLVFLVLAAFEDLGQGSEKLKQLLDLYLLLRTMDGATDWEGLFARRAPENLVAVTANVLALCADLFEARDELARLCAALDRRRGLCALAGRDEVLRLVAAPQKHRANLVWFGRVYPGSLVHFLLWFWAFGLPDNLVRLGPAWLRSQLAVVAAAARWRRT